MIEERRNLPFSVRDIILASVACHEDIIDMASLLSRFSNLQQLQSCYIIALDMGEHKFTHTVRLLAINEVLLQ